MPPPAVWRLEAALYSSASEKPIVVATQRGRLMRMVFGILLLLSMLSPRVTAQTRPQPRPGPEQERMSDWLGTWTFTLDNKGSLDPAAPPVGMCTGKQTWEMFGAFFAVRHVDTNCGGIAGKSLEIMRWEPAKKAYVITDFDDDGVYSEFTIAVNGPTWSLTDIGVVRGQKFWHKCAWTMSPEKTRIVQRCDESTNGKTWTLSADGLFEKVAGRR